MFARAEMRIEELRQAGFETNISLLTKALESQEQSKEQSDKVRKNRGSS